MISPYLREGRTSRKILYVCDLHFKEDDVIRNTSILLKDGSIDTINCLRVKLKSSSVPCNFDAERQASPTINFHTVKVESNVSSMEISTIPEGKEEPEVTPKEIVRTEAIHPVRIKKITELLQPYDLNMLEKDLNILWETRNSRIWVSFKIRSGLMISYFGENPRFAKKTILVMEDMSTEVIP